MSKLVSFMVTWFMSINYTLTHATVWFGLPLDCVVDRLIVAV